MSPSVPQSLFLEAAAVLCAKIRGFPRGKFLQKSHDAAGGIPTKCLPRKGLPLDVAAAGDEREGKEGADLPKNSCFLQGLPL